MSVLLRHLSTACLLLLCAGCGARAPEVAPPDSNTVPQAAAETFVPAEPESDADDSTPDPEPVSTPPADSPSPESETETAAVAGQQDEQSSDPSVPPTSGPADVADPDAQPQQVTAGDDAPALPLILRTSRHRVLLVFGDDDEAQTAIEACNERDLPCDVQATLDVSQLDLAKYHAIIGGSNCMDYFGDAERQRDEAFDPLVAFVENGGHLFLFGTYHGRNCQHLQRFGLNAISGGNNGYTPVAGRTEVLFDGLESIVPPTDKMTSVGALTVSVPHVVMLRRSEGVRPGEPALVTLEHGRGRVSATMVEPVFRDDLWLITVAVNWISRGAPTTPAQLSESAVVDETTFDARGTVSAAPLPPDEDMQAAIRELRELFREQLVAAQQNSEQAALADDLLEFADSESRPAMQLALRQEAQQLLVNAGRLEDALDVLRGTAELYQIDAATQRVDMLRERLRTARSPFATTEAARLAIDLAWEAAAAYRYDEAVLLANVGRSAARSVTDAHLLDLAEQQARRFGELQRMSRGLTDLQQRVADNPEDAAANADLGRFYCLIADDWSVGLPHLLKGDNETLRAIAQAESQAPADADGRIALGDAWRNAVSGLVVPERRGAQRRARYWYQQAIVQLTGVQQARVARTLATLPSTDCELILVCRQSGRSLIELTPEHLTWEQQAWQPPVSVQVGGQSWHPETQPRLDNHGATRFLPHDVDVFSAELTVADGRGIVEIQSREPDRIVIMFDDVPAGDDEYTIVLSFGG